MKYALLSILFVFNNELLSLLALSIMAVFFIGDILVERSKM